MEGAPVSTPGWSQVGVIRGPQGVPGEQGPPGNTGSTGPPGAPGADGQDGAPGATGPRGETGATGERGEQGIQGNPGEQGPPGPGFRFRGAVATRTGTGPPDSLPTSGQIVGDAWYIEDEGVMVIWTAAD
jgi:hypothetical protein